MIPIERDVSHEPLASSGIIHPLLDQAVGQAIPDRAHPTNVEAATSLFNYSEFPSSEELVMSKTEDTQPQSYNGAPASTDVALLDRRQDDLDSDSDILTQDDVQAIKKRIEGLILTPQPHPLPSVSPRESELVSMVRA